MNKVILMGRLTRDPEIRYTQSQKAVATFTLAVERRVRRNADGQPPQQTADFIPIVAWDKTAELCGNYLTKGRQVLIEGRMQVRNYDAQDGSKRYVTEVIADNVEFIGSRSDGGAAPVNNNRAMNNGSGFQGGYQQTPPPAPDTAGFGTQLPADDDIPF